MQGFITIKEASKLTGKHPDTIRRIMRSNKGSKNIAKDNKGRVILDKQWIVSAFELNTDSTNDDNEPVDKEPIQQANQATDPTVMALVEQLKAKDMQIEQLMQANREKEANQTKLADQFQQIIAGLQLPANTQTPRNETTQNAYEPPMQTDVEVPMQSKVKPKKGKPKAKKKPSVKPDIVEVKQPKKRWWRK